MKVWNFQLCTVYVVLLSINTGFAADEVWGRNAHAKLITAFNVIGYTREVSEAVQSFTDKRRFQRLCTFYEEHETIF